MLYNDTHLSKGIVMSKHRIENATLPFKDLQKKLEMEKIRKENPLKALGMDLFDTAAKDFANYYIARN